MPCQILDRYALELTKYMNETPTLSAEFQSGVLQLIAGTNFWDSMQPGTRARALYCCAVAHDVYSAYIEGATARWPQFSQVPLNDVHSLYGIQQYFNEAADQYLIDNAEFLMTVTRGASQTRGTVIRKRGLALGHAARLLTMSERYMLGGKWDRDEVAGDVGKTMFDFMRVLHGVDMLVTFLEKLHEIRGEPQGVHDGAT